jgi:putative flippase GtrA
LHPIDPSTPVPARRRFRDLPGVRSVLALFPPGQFLRYICVGIFNTAFGYSSFALINFLLRRQHVPASYVFAMAISSVINITVAYLGYKIFVFRTKRNYLREWTGAMAVGFSGFLPGVFLLSVLVRVFNFILPASVTLFHHTMGRKELAPYVANLFLTCVVPIYTFIGHKKITFRSKPAPEA